MKPVRMWLASTSYGSIFETPFGFGCLIVSGLVLWLFWNSHHGAALRTVLERAKALGSWPDSG